MPYDVTFVDGGLRRGDHFSVQTDELVSSVENATAAILNIAPGGNGRFVVFLLLNLIQSGSVFFVDGSEELKFTLRRLQILASAIELGA